MTVCEWRTMESAPKDGTPVIVFREGRQYVARWHERWGTWGVSAAVIPSEPDSPFVDIGRKAFGGLVFAEGPTHWQPLPEPPVTETAHSREPR